MTSNMEPAYPREGDEPAPDVPTAMLMAFAEAFVIVQAEKSKTDALAWLRHVARLLTEREVPATKVVSFTAPKDRRRALELAEANRRAGTIFREQVLPKCVARIKAIPSR